jgi:hypothetical protein
MTCRRKGCGETFKGGDREGEKCVHHPGVPIFHEGSKGYSCCKRRVLEFDQFMTMEGCKTKDRHLFVGKAKKEGEEEKVEKVRYVYIQRLQPRTSLTITQPRLLPDSNYSHRIALSQEDR